jgi:hypothetical protein
MVEFTLSKLVAIHWNGNYKNLVVAETGLKLRDSLGQHTSEHASSWPNSGILQQMNQFA